MSHCRDTSVHAANQTMVSPLVHNLPSTIAPNGTVSSNLIVMGGYQTISVGLTLSQPGTLAIQRYLDANGTVSLGAPQSVSLTAGVPNVLTISDDNIVGSFQVIVTNGAGSTAMIGDLGIAVAMVPTTLNGIASGSYTTANQTTVSVPATPGGGPVLAANPSAKFRTLVCPRTNTAPVWVSFGTSATVVQGIKDMQPGDSYEMSIAQGNFYQGVITAISANGAQTLLVVEGV